MQHPILNTNTLKLLLEECPSATNNRLVCRISDELLTHGWVYILPQRPQSPVISKNWRILTSYTVGFTLGRHLWALWDTIRDFLQSVHN